MAGDFEDNPCAFDVYRCLRRKYGRRYQSLTVYYCMQVIYKRNYFLSASAFREEDQNRGKPLEHETLRATNVYFMTYMVIFAVSVLLVSIENKDLVTNFAAVAATFNNIGQGFLWLDRWRISDILRILRNIFWCSICWQADWRFSRWCCCSARLSGNGEEPSNIKIKADSGEDESEPWYWYTKRGTGDAGSSSCVIRYMVNYWKIDIRMVFVMVNLITCLLYTNIIENNN